MPQDSEPAGSLPPVIPVETIQRWLPEIFPEGIAHRTFVVRAIAAKTLFVMFYTGAIEGAGVWLRPSQVTSMSDKQAAKSTASQRSAWRVKSLTAGRVKPRAGAWYAADTREPIRDETLRNGLIPLGAVVERIDLPTTSSLPRYAIRSAFADLLLALHAGTAGIAEIEKWQTSHLSGGALTRVQVLRNAAASRGAAGRLAVRYPNGEFRFLRAGPSAAITKAVVEVFAPRFLREPAILLLSESGEKVVARDDVLLRHIGLRIKVDRNLPDVVLADVAVGHEKIVFVEVVATAGVVTSARRQALADVASSARFGTESVFFVTAFLDRSQPEFRRCVAEIAWDTFAWFVAEPNHLVCFRADAALAVNSLA